MTAERKIGRALLSVSQKNGMVTFAQNWYAVTD